MAFESLSDRLGRAMKKISGQATLTDKNMSDMLEEIRFALLDGDVSVEVINPLIADIREKARGTEVIKSVNPSQMIVKIVNDALVSILGEKEQELDLSAQPTVLLMVGLQGSGKTTSAAKIAYYLKKKKAKKVLMIAADLSRPAAVEQLQVLGISIDVDVVSGPDVMSAVRSGLHKGKTEGYDVIIIDSAGRYHIDAALMDELREVKTLAQPNEILLTVDAMSGQDMINVAKGFNDVLTLSGLVVTKFDADARGGGILSVRYGSGVPIYFVGEGEKVEDLDLFYPDRTASRILGMGDIVSLVEKAQDKMDVELAEKSAQRMMSGQFTLDDMLVQLEQVKKMGPLSGILKLMPGMGNVKEMMKQVNDSDADAAMRKTKAIIQSMTKYERSHPDSMRASRKNRVAKGAGVTTTEVNRVLSQYEKMKDQMKMLSRMMKS